MNSRVLLSLGLLMAIGGVFYLSQRGTGVGSEAQGGEGGPAGVTEISFLYSTETRQWVEEAAEGFQRDNPSIRVKRVGMGSLEAAQAILDGREKPVVWSPADSAVLRMLELDWAAEPSRSPLFAKEGQDAPEPLVLTPLVFVVWEDRAEVLLKAGDGKGVSWKSIYRAVASDQGWPALGGKAEWGFVKLGHTDPMRSNSGLQAMLLATFEYYDKRSGLTVGDLLDPKYQEWVRQLEKGVTKFEPSSGTFMTDMMRFGPAKYDIAVVYESLAISQIETAQGRWGSLKVYYPPVTMWSNHPAAVLQAPWVTEKQKEAARQWLAYLRSRPVQEKAVGFGFRPADASVPLKTADGSNPFTRLAEHGIQVEVPPAAEVPEGPVVRTLLEMWSRVVAAHR
jgi:ABC-type Fe3+ transport system substrate-binding protein